MPKSTSKDWNRDEHILAFNLYCKIPFGTIHMRNPKLIELAEILGRSVGAVSYKLANFARLDPTLQARGIRGMDHGAKGEEEVWREFARDGEKLVYESEKLLAERTGTSLERLAEIDERELPAEGLDRERLVKTRVNLHFFRSAVLAAYNFRCCVSGLAVQPLLVASHIVPWSLDAKHRMNPRNGLCLNALHDRAFDRGLMTVTSNFRVKISDSLKASSKADEEPLSWLRRFMERCSRCRKSFRQTRRSSASIANAGSGEERATMKLVAFQKLGQNRDSPRLWLESRRLDTLGFSAGTAFTVKQIRNGVRLTPSLAGTHHVSQRRAAGRRRPIIDLASRTIPIRLLAGRKCESMQAIE